MKNVKAARRYAKALLLIGKEDGQIEVYREQLEGFVSLISGAPDLDAAINNPIYESGDRKNVLRAVLEKTDCAPVVKAFLLLLFDKVRMTLIDAIAEEFAKLADEFKGVARAELITATDLADDMVEKIREGLGRMTGKSVVLTVEKDPALIGGVVARIGDLVLDGSVRTQLSNLKETLKRSEAV